MSEHRIQFVHGEILEYHAPFLISSGNPYLNMSGGVNGALMMKYGESLQTELHEHLKSLGKHSVEAPFSYRFRQSIGCYKGVTYSVAIDVWYECEAQTVAEVLIQSLELLNPGQDETVVFPALGTGYGKLSKLAFGCMLREFKSRFSPYKLVLVERDEHKLKELLSGYSSPEQ